MSVCAAVIRRLSSHASAAGRCLSKTCLPTADAHLGQTMGLSARRSAILVSSHYCQVHQVGRAFSVYTLYNSGLNFDTIGLVFDQGAVPYQAAGGIDLKNRER